VHGDGAVGLAAALTLAHQGLHVALHGAVPGAGGSAHAAGGDIRAWALNAASVALLQRLRVWEALPPDASTAVLEMQVEGDQPGAALHFSAWQQRSEALAWIVDAGELLQALQRAVAFAPRIERLAPAPVAAASGAVAVSPGPVAAPALTLLCEGRDSAARARLGAQWLGQPYGHRAIAARLATDAAHAGTARQWFRSPDVLALLPLDRPAPGQGLGLVWSLPEERAQALLALDDTAFEAALLEATAGAAGTLRLVAPRASWPLALHHADPVCGPGWALLGDAAHVVHPLAGQGLNLGLADVEALAHVLAAREPWRALGDEKLLRRYARERRAPTWLMGRVTDGLLHLFASEAPLLRTLRNRGLGWVDALPPLKRALAAQALAAPR
jgi:ubiquinone biosynthesis UbiH/UbiF/VisC/COQ6 family hydroxylase